MKDLLNKIAADATSVKGTIEGNTPDGSAFEGSTALINVMNWGFALAGIACVAFIIYGGIKWNMAQGDPGKVKQGTQIITYAIVGLIIVVLAAAVANFAIAAISGS